MSKQYIDIVNGQLVYADPLKITDTFSPVSTLSKSKTGINIVRASARQLINTRLSKPGCDDGCLTTPFTRRFSFDYSGQLPETASEKAAILAEFDQFIADLTLLKSSNWLSGVKPSTSTVFPPKGG